MKIITRDTLNRVLTECNELFSDVPPQIKFLIEAIFEQQEEIEELQMRVSRLIDAIPSSGIRGEL